MGCLDSIVFSIAVGIALFVGLLVTFSQWPWMLAGWAAAVALDMTDKRFATRSTRGKLTVAASGAVAGLLVGYIVRSLTG